MKVLNCFLMIFSSTFQLSTSNILFRRLMPFLVFWFLFQFSIFLSVLPQIDLEDVSNTSLAKLKFRKTNYCQCFDYIRQTSKKLWPICSISQSNQPSAPSLAISGKIITRGSTFCRKMHSLNDHQCCIQPYADLVLASLSHFISFASSMFTESARRNAIFLFWPIKFTRRVMKVGRW